MQLIVRSVGRTFAVDVPEICTTRQLKAAIEDVEFIPACHQNLSCNATSLIDCAALVDGDVVTLSVGIDGGMRDKWRKKRMRRLVSSIFNS